MDGWMRTYLCCEDVDEYFVGERDAEYTEIVRVRDDAGELVDALRCPAHGNRRKA
jgi:hypothetical protein